MKDKQVKDFGNNMYHFILFQLTSFLDNGTAYHYSRLREIINSVIMMKIVMMMMIEKLNG